MNAETADDEKLEDYAVDVRKLRGVHEQLVAKRSEIEALIAEERNLGSVEAMAGPAYERLKSQVDRLLDEWENEKTRSGSCRYGICGLQQAGAGALRYRATDPRCPGRTSRGGDGASIRAPAALMTTRH